MTRWLSKLFKKNVHNNQKPVDKQIVANKVSNETKDDVSKANVEQWVETQKVSGIPLYDLWRQLLEKSSQADELELKKAYTEAANKLEDILVLRNINGKEYEKDGEDNKAIELYEANIKDNFDGSHPYERLRVIYTKMQKHEDVIRICEAYILNGQHDPQLKTKYQKIIFELKGKIGDT